MPTSNGLPPTTTNGDRESPLPMMSSTPRGAAGRASGAAAQLELAFEQRSSEVFRQWLRSMATDAEAALAAAMSYRELSATGRDHWVASLQNDVRDLDVPKIAVFAPLLAVEQDPHRRQVLESLALEDEDETDIIAGRLALTAARGSERIYVVVCPLYLKFVQVLACGVRAGRFSWVRHDPIVSKLGAPVAGDLLKGEKLEQVGFNTVMDELAAAILSHRRQGLELPEAIFMLSDLLGSIGP